MRTLIISILLLYPTFHPANVTHAQQHAEALDRRPLSVAFVLDASGSMRENDPDELRKAAAQAVVSMLNPEDNVAVLEFATEAQKLSDGSGATWLSAEKRDQIFQAISNAGDKGSFTDFRAGIKKSLDLFREVSDDRRSIVLLLTDGVLEPNPKASTYAPWHLNYRRATIGKSWAERSEIYQTSYRSRLATIARRIIFEDLVPELRSKEIEVFTIGLGSEADQSFLNRLANETTQSNIEVRSFHAERATELVNTFTRLLPYWTDKTILRVEQGSIKPNTEQSIYLDEFVQDPTVLTLIDGDGTFYVQAADGTPETVVPSTHEATQLFELSYQQTPGIWEYGFQNGNGTYRTIWVGENSLQILALGLNSSYTYGDSVTVRAELRAGTKNALDLLEANTEVIAEIVRVGPDSSSNQYALERRGDSFHLRFLPTRPGLHRLELTAYAEDREGRDILPRPSISYQFEVLPAFSVTPDQLYFGDAGEGSEISRTINVHSGLASPSEVTISGKIVRSSRNGLEDGTLSPLPKISPSNFTIEPGSARKQEIQLRLPNDVEWGDFEGIIRVQASTGDIEQVRFRIHVPSFWEQVRLPLLGLLLLLLMIGAYCVYLWGYLGSPSGTLIPLETPPGVLMEQKKLSRVRQGWLTRLFNWRKNRLQIGNYNADLRLSLLPSNLKGELVFYRFSGAYLKNASPDESDRTIEVQEPEMGPISLKPGRQLRLRSRSKISLGDYTFRYETS